MQVKRFVVFATRAEDNSTIVRTDLHISEAAALMEKAMETGLASRVEVQPQDRDGDCYAEEGPVLPLEEALSWRQPADGLTELFR